MSERVLGGVHHVTAISGDPQANVDFYAGVLGLRLVKQTVNYDDPGTYHLYYGDALGSPGTILTFFPWPGARRGRAGAGQPVATALAVPPGAFDFWHGRLQRHGISLEEGVRFGAPFLAFGDPDGMRLELVEVGDSAGAGGGGAGVWTGAGVGPEHAVRRVHHITLAVTDPGPTARFLTETLGAAPVGQEDARQRFAFPGSDFVDVVAAAAGSARGTMGAGIVHHVAWRTPDDAAQQSWQRHLADAGANVSEVMDRQYFHSIYFREPGGVLYEIATDPPGFTADGEDKETLGGALRLPRWLEPSRTVIAQRLPTLRLPAGAAAAATPAEVAS